MPLPLIILGVSLGLSILAFAIILPIKPNAVRITERFVCPAGSKMEVEVVKHSYHRPGERGIVVQCRGPSGSRYVNGKAFLCLWVMLFVASLPIAAVIGILISRSLPA